jgi:hypothetical protein
MTCGAILSNRFCKSAISQNMASPKLILLISKFALFNNKTLPLVENLLLLLLLVERNN